MQKALELDNSHANAHTILSITLAEQGQVDAALAEAHRGISLESRAPRQAHTPTLPEPPALKKR